MRSMRLACTAVAVLATAAAASAQQPQSSPALAQIRASEAQDMQEDTAPRPSFAKDIDYIALVAREEGLLLRALQVYAEERSDKQLGATSSASGTTTLVSKGTVPQILAFALENGAVSRTISGTTVTVRSNVGGAARALAGKGFFQLTPGEDPSLTLLSRLSFSASFDTSRGNDATTLTADRQQLSQWTGRLQIINQRDPQGSSALGRWRARLAPLQTTVSRATLRLSQALERDSAVQDWLAATTSAVTTAKTTPANKPPGQQVMDIEAALRAREAIFPPIGQLQPETRLALDEYERSTSAFVKERHEVLSALASGALVSIEYTNDRPVRAPLTSNIRLVGEVGGTVDLTGNASMTFFDQKPVGVTSSVRDAQFSGQLDVKFGSADSVGAFVFSVAAKYLYQFENSFNDDGFMVPSTKGATAIGQFKLLVPVKGSGVKIPVSVTLANRTELIKESVVRANVGITYDLDPVFALFRP
jgi:hypothetical protein